MEPIHTCRPPGGLRALRLPRPRVPRPVPQRIAIHPAPLLAPLGRPRPQPGAPFDFCPRWLQAQLRGGCDRWGRREGGWEGRRALASNAGFRCSAAVLAGACCAVHCWSGGLFGKRSLTPCLIPRLALGRPHPRRRGQQDAARPVWHCAIAVLPLLFRWGVFFCNVCAGDLLVLCTVAPLHRKRGLPPARPAPGWRPPTRCPLWQCSTLLSGWRPP